MALDKIMVKDHSDSERGNPLLPHWLRFPISRQDSTYHDLKTPAVKHWLEWEIAKWVHEGSIWQTIAPWWTLYHGAMSHSCSQGVRAATSFTSGLGNTDVVKAFNVNHYITWLWYQVCIPDFLITFTHKKNERNVVFNDILVMVIWQQIYGKRPLSEGRNPLPPLHGVLFSISSKGYFICTISLTGQHIPQPLSHQLWSTGWNEK